MYVTKDGAIQKIQEDTFPYWQGLGWSLDEDRDGTADSLSGGGDTSGLLPIADPTGVTTETTDDNTVTGSGTISVATFPADTVALAIKLEGDAFPRWLLLSDSTDGLYFGDGTYDAYSDGANIFLRQGNLALSAPSGHVLDFGDAKFRAATGPVLESPDESLHRIIVADDGTLSTEAVT